MASGTVSEYAKITGQLSGLSHHVKITDAYFTLTSIGHLESHGEVTGTDVSGDLTVSSSLAGKLTIGGSAVNPYDGQYVFEPSAETQIVPINGLRATDDIIINPIPQNYGRITWNGSTLTVS